MRYEDMLIDTPYNLSDVENRSRKPQHGSENRCTYCVGQKVFTWYPVEDIVVVRRWRTSSVFAPHRPGLESGGWFSWRCPNHPFNGSASSNVSGCPEHLRPKCSHRCKERELGQACGEKAVGRYGEKWLCERHARSFIILERQRNAFTEEVVEVEDPNAESDT